MIQRVRIRNYKSLADVDVTFRHPLTVLVGRNGSGKSNFVDALAFVADCLNESVSKAFDRRGGVLDTRRRTSKDADDHDSVQIEIGVTFGNIGSTLPLAQYDLAISTSFNGSFRIVSENCTVYDHEGRPSMSFSRNRSLLSMTGKGVSSDDAEVLFNVPPDKLMLSYLPSNIENLSYDVVSALANIRHYSPLPSTMRTPRKPDSTAGQVLRTDGGNVAAVLNHLSEQDDYRYDRLCRLMAQMVPRLRKIEHVDIMGYHALRFLQEVDGKELEFTALNMSDGTLRALAVMLTAFQTPAPSMIMIEEPETAIHPDALGIVMSVLQFDAPPESQVLVTTHSPELLDINYLSVDQFLVVESDKGKTRINPLGERTLSVIKKYLATPGDLLGNDELGSVWREGNEKSYYEPFEYDYSK